MPALSHQNLGNSFIVCVDGVPARSRICVNPRGILDVKASMGIDLTDSVAASLRKSLVLESHDIPVADVKAFLVNLIDSLPNG